MNEVKDRNFKTSSIATTLNSFATKNFIPLNECDFTIKKTLTYIKTNLDEEFSLSNENINELYKDKAKIISEHLELYQHYLITVFKIKKTKIKLNYSIEMDEFSSHPFLILHPDSFVPYKNKKLSETLKLLFTEINKIKAKNKILINIFDQKMIKNIKMLTRHIHNSTFTKRVKIPLFNGVEPIATVQSKLIHWYKHKSQEDKQQIIEVQKDEVLIEYKKAVYGKSGFNSFGEFIDQEFLTNEDDLQVHIDDDSIGIEDNDTKKLYKSKIKGYVNLTPISFSVENKVKKNKLSRNEKSLAQDEDNNIEVLISQNDTNKDSIGEGVSLVSESIHVNGHVGANSVLEAINLEIDGATHLDSRQYAKNAKIYRHKGTLRCHTAKIKLLEGGTIHASNVEIETTLNGTIHARNVTIGHVKSNLKVYASDSITIRLVSGEDNLFKINYKDVPISLANLEFLNSDIEELKFSLDEAQRHSNSKVAKIKEQLTKLKSSVNTIKQSALKAKITIEKPLIGLNTINFTFDNDESISYKTNAQSYESFYIQTTDDNITLLPVNKSIPLD